MHISVVITAYNRANVVSRTIRSVLGQPGFESFHEIIVVDDASVDETVAVISSEFSHELEVGRMRMIQNPSNLGVTGSKNVGFGAALGSWVIFLDSDDALNDNVWNPMLDVLNDAKASPIVFFRCVDQNGHFVGTPFKSDIYLDLDAYLKHTSYGEALTAINKGMADSVPYIADLRGYEGLGCCRLIKKYGPALLSTLVARCYDQSGDDRLSVSRGLLGRMPLLARGHWMLVREFGQDMGYRQRLGFMIKGSLYYIIGMAFRLAQGTRK